MSSVRSLVLALLDDPDTSVDDTAVIHLSPDFRQKVNGQWLTRHQFLDGVATLRQATRSVQVTVLDEEAGLQVAPTQPRQHPTVITGD